MLPSTTTDEGKSYIQVTWMETRKATLFACENQRACARCHFAAMGMREIIMCDCVCHQENYGA
jgi:hypothetical protein